MENYFIGANTTNGKLLTAMTKYYHR